ncbi:inorganic triphosphatase [Shewanella glacialipiscicola]|uniref:CYTH domain-containing protein n=1 Tax=Shewanella glacialipiscicola TaxID=614069 RepID=UPI003D79E76A
MNAEIELKLFFLPKYQQSLINKLDSLDNSVPQGQRRLTNGYFDTPDLQLRQWDMGLRVRGDDEHREQTIKTAGQVIGGIHSRPEYNVTIQLDSPNLSLFPSSIWPSNADLASTQVQLGCIFHTDFYRRAWHIHIDDSLVEVALDIGEITANGQQEALCELEFELLSGDTEALLKLAIQVASVVPVRLGKASKAQRGYRLAGKAPPLHLTALEFLPLAEHSETLSPDLTASCQTLLEIALERWQLLESMIADEHEHEHEPEACIALWWRMRACIRLLRITLSQFALLDARLLSQFMLIEKQLDFIEPAQALTALLGSQYRLFHRQSQSRQLKQQLRFDLDNIKLDEQLSSLWQQPEYGQLQLAVVEQLLKVSAGELGSIKPPSLRQHADSALQASWQAIFEVMSCNTAMTSTHYLQASTVLDESILVGQAYGSLYDVKSRDMFRAPWLDLTLGIKTLACYSALEHASCKLGIDLHEWLDDKQQSLLFAMESTRHNALQQLVYW